MSTDLGTNNSRVAATRFAEVLRLRNGRPKPVQGNKDSVVRIPDVPGTGIVQDSTEDSTEDALRDWYGGESEFDKVEQTGSGWVADGAPKATDGASSTDGGNWSASLAPNENVSGPDVQGLRSLPKGLSTEERERMHGLLASVVGRVNVLAVGMAVHVFGRVPAEPDPKDTELLDKAWALQLSEWFANKEIKPYVLILGASLGLGIGMFAEGTPKPKKVKANAQTDGNAAK